MSVDLILHTLNLTLLQTASRFDLHGAKREGRKASAKWLTALYRRVLEVTKPSVLWEVGAFSAEFSISLRDVLPECTRYAFEANPYNYERFREAATAAGVNYRHLAISDSHGQCAFNVPLGDELDPSQRISGKGSMLRKTSVRYEQVNVPMTTIDALAQAEVSHGRHAMWIDVEGFAHQVLKGATETLARTDFVFIEVEDRAFWKDQKLSDSTERVLYDAGFVPVARDFEYYHQYNLLFMRPAVFRLAAVQEIFAVALSQPPAAAATAAEAESSR